MGRPYTAAAYRTLVQAVREQMPQASIGTDVIVGFPGETDDDAHALADFVDGLPVSYLHVFPYSDRPGTVAASMTSKVAGRLVRERSRRLRDIGAAKAAAFRGIQRGLRHRALVLEDGWTGVTGNYLKVRFDRQLERNQWAEVEVMDSSSLDARVLAAW